VARSTRLTPDLADDLVALLAAGMSASAAARTLGLPARTVRRWALVLRDRVEQQRGAGPTAAGAEEAGLALLLLRSSDWRASAYFLERAYPERWGLRPPRDIDAQPR
jgi:hypothetical protein